MKLTGVISTRLVRVVLLTAVTAAGSIVIQLPATVASASVCSLQIGGPQPWYAYEYSSYKGTMFTNGGVAPYSYALASGSTLPLGLGMNKKGVISGVPLETTAPSTATFDVQVTDSATPTKCTGEVQAHLTVFQSSQIPTTDGLIQLVEGLVTYGPECVLATVVTLTGGGPPDTNCIGLI